MLRQTLIRRRQAGFSLVEMMVAIVAGLIVIGAALAFTVSTVRAYSENIGSSRLSQELRTGMNLVVRELRRAGYDAASVTRVMTPEPPSQFVNLSVSAADGCVFYEYDRGKGELDDAPATGEMRGVRYDTNTNSVQVNTDDPDSNCNGDEWVNLTDPRVVNITEFKPVLTTTRFCSVLAERDTSNPKDGIMDEFDIAEGAVQLVSLSLQGDLAAKPGVVRTVTDSVRIRADQVGYCINVDKTVADQCKQVTAGIVKTQLCGTP